MSKRESVVETPSLSFLLFHLVRVGLCLETFLTSKQRTKNRCPILVKGVRVILKRNFFRSFKVYGLC